MKKYLFLFLLFAVFSACSSNNGNVERLFEDGIKITVNNIEPYALQGETQNLTLEIVFSIDLEIDSILDTGLTDIETFDVDEEENIFIIQWQSKENYIYKFDKNGNFINSFCRRGQGPGELEWGGMVLITQDNEVIAKDPSKPKFLVFDIDGNFLREKRLPKPISIRPLSNNKYLISWQDQTSEYYLNHVGICDQDFKEITELSSFKWNNPMYGKFEVNCPRLNHTFSQNRIFVSPPERVYEIHVYDHDANLLEKIRKRYDPVVIPEEYKIEFYKRYPKGNPYRNNLYFTKFWPPIRSLYSDDEGRLYVMTYEEGLDPEEYIFDIFNSDGVFIETMSINNLIQNRPSYLKIKNNQVYFIREKKSGFKELVVCSMKWNILNT